MVIDFHMHTFPDAIAGRVIKALAEASSLKPYTNGTVSDTERKMKQWGIDRGVLLNIATTPSQEKTINTVAAENNKRENFNAFGSVYPFADDAENELPRIKDLGLPGIKMHPEYQNFFIDDPRVFGIYETCSALGLAIAFHTGADKGYGPPVHATPDRVLNVIRNFPKLKVIAAHFGGLMFWDAVDYFLLGKNVYLDTAFTCGYLDTGRMRDMILRHGTDKVLFASDCPWENPADTLSKILSMHLPSADEERIFSGNALNLLGR